MAISAKQIGWSQQSSLLWNISKQLENLIKVTSKVSVSGGGNPPTPTGIPFQDYPPAGLTSEGAKFIYTDGVELISYHIKGMSTISNGGNGFENYLCSINFPPSQGPPFFFPGSVTGMFQSGGEGSIVTTPLANGGVVELDGVHVPVSSLDFNLFDYGNNPQPDGSYNYALVVDATVENPDALNITGLMAYDFEFLLPNFFESPTIFQD
jgi:hypothetical protein